jgi:glyoxylase-like metal-dependent hydrolase (beta-lactamase superfamily II)
MKVVTLSFNDFCVNTYVVIDPETHECAIVDPGMFDTTETSRLVKTIESMHLKPVHLINTHQHIDHVMGNDFIDQLYGLKPEANKNDDFLAVRLVEQAQSFGLRRSPQIVPVSTYLTNGDIVKIGDGQLKVLTVPGHSPGSIALYDEKDAFVITGDALFCGSIGRTDLPGGDYDILLQSIREKLFTLPNDTVVLPGHGPASTIGDEKRLNPYFRGV